MTTAHAQPHASADAPLCCARAIEKAFFGHRVVRGVDLNLKRGQVHILTGPNGAGKSTLLKIFAGVHKPDAGSVLLKGRKQRFHGPADAREAGIATVHQELSLVPSLSLLDNLMLGREPLWLGQRARQTAAKQARRHLGDMDLDLDLEAPVETLSLGQQQLVEIVRGLMTSAEVYLLDEPTSALPRAAAKNLYQQLGRLREQDCATLLVSHKLDEILALADHISVMRDGEVVWQTANNPTAYSHEPGDLRPKPELRARLIAAMAPELPQTKTQTQTPPPTRLRTIRPGPELTRVKADSRLSQGPAAIRPGPAQAQAASQPIRPEPSGPAEAQADSRPSQPRLSPAIHSDLSKAGQEAETRSPRATSAGTSTQTPRLELTGASLVGQPAFGPIDLRVNPGEILGLAGLQGSGIQLLLHALVGSKTSLTGTRVALDGQGLALRSPQQARRAGIVLLTCDRKQTGLIPTLGAIDNTVLSALDRFTRFGWFDRQAARQAATKLLERVRLAAADLDAPVTTLSGGNQQKVYLARCLLPNPRLLLLDDPTRGVDVGAKRDLHALIHAHAREGHAVIWAATELTELTDHCHRIVALARGRVTGRFTPPYNTDAVVAATLGERVQEASL
ncbi:MAG: ATP-binding cassette domain-containing protein [Nannocystaceae bacterium]